MDSVKVKGQVEIVITDANGNVTDEYKGSNLVTSLGQELMADLIAGSGTAPSHLAMGDDTTSPAKSQTDLVGTEHERVSATVSATNNVITVAATMGGSLGAPVTVGEFGIFNHASAGTLVARFISPSFSLAASSSLNITWTLQIGE